MCLRPILFVFTSLLLVFGLLLVGSGLWLTIDEASMVRVVGDLLNATNVEDGLSDLPRLKSIIDEVATLNFLNVVLIAVGGVVFFVALSGFCGVKRDSPRLLIVFAFFTLVFLALQIALIVTSTTPTVTPSLTSGKGSEHQILRQELSTTPMSQIKSQDHRSCRDCSACFSRVDFAAWFQEFSSLPASTLPALRPGGRPGVTLTQPRTSLRWKPCDTDSKTRFV